MLYAVQQNLLAPKPSADYVEVKFPMKKSDGDSMNYLCLLHLMNHIRTMLRIIPPLKAVLLNLALWSYIWSQKSQQQLGQGAMRPWHQGLPNILS